MDRDILEENHIFYVEEPHRVLVAPEHIRYLRSALLDFDCTISDRFGFNDDADIKNLDWEQVFKDHDVEGYEKFWIEGYMKRHEEMQTEAIRYLNLHKRGIEQKDFYPAFYLKALKREVEAWSFDSRRVARVKFYYDSFEYAASHPWKLFAKDGKLRQKNHGLTEPKPDFTAYFLIYNSSSNQLTHPSRQWQWVHNAKEGLVRNFSLEIFKHLVQRGLEPSPTGLFGKSWKADMEKSELICYPWLIAEHEKEGLAEECYCRAANTANATLKMYQILAKYAENKHSDMHIPPVAVLTTVGQEVKIWIGYAYNGGDDCEMACIWKGDITKIVDIIKFEAIIENLHTWAMRELRPCISSYIDQWLFRFPLYPSHDTTSVNLPGSMSFYKMPLVEVASKSANSPETTNYSKATDSSETANSSEADTSPKTLNTLERSPQDMLKLERESLPRKTESIFKENVDKLTSQHDNNPFCATSSTQIEFDPGRFFNRDPSKPEDKFVFKMPPYYEQFLPPKVTKSSTRSCSTQTRILEVGRTTTWDYKYDPFTSTSRNKTRSCYDFSSMAPTKLDFNNRGMPQSYFRKTPQSISTQTELSANEVEHLDKYTLPSTRYQSIFNETETPENDTFGLQFNRLFSVPGGFSGMPESLRKQPSIPSRLFSSKNGGSSGSKNEPNPNLSQTSGQNNSVFQFRGSGGMSNPASGGTQQGELPFRNNDKTEEEIREAKESKEIKEVREVVEATRAKNVKEVSEWSEALGAKKAKERGTGFNYCNPSTISEKAPAHGNLVLPILNKITSLTNNEEDWEDITDDEKMTNASPTDQQKNPEPRTKGMDGANQNLFGVGKGNVLPPRKRIYEPRSTVTLIKVRLPGQANEKRFYAALSNKRY